MNDNFPGLTNHTIAVPGSNVTAHLGSFDVTPNKWNYSLWTGEGDTEELLAVGELDLTGSGLTVTPEQVARVAFILELEYKTEK